MALEGKRINELTEVSKVDTSSKLAIDTGGEEALSITLKNLIDSSGVSSVGVATTEKAGIVKPDGTTISVSSDGTISSSGSGFSFEGTKAEFDAAVTAGTITDDSVSLITDDVSGDTVATKADLAVVDNSKADTALSNVLANIDYVIESKYPTDDDPSWYRKYKSGWVEQGGISGSIAGGARATVILLKPYGNTLYSVMVQPIGAYTANAEANNTIPTRTKTNFVIACGQISSQAFAWMTKGMGAI